MVYEKKKIIAVVGEIDFSNSFFEKISFEEKEQMINAVSKGISQPVTFYDETGVVLFYILFDLECDWLHVRLLIGNFARWFEFLNYYLMGLAKYMKKNRITFCTKKKQVKEYALKCGFNINQAGDYEKRIVV